MAGSAYRESGAQMRNRCCYRAQLPVSSAGEYRTLSNLAEGEELGSNLLQVAESSSWGLGEYG
jgi:hypothetical protein